MSPVRTDSSQWHTTPSGSLMVYAPSVNGTLARLARCLLTDGISVDVERRGGVTREIAGVTLIEVSKPWQRLPLLGGRAFNPWVTLAEFPWLIAGRNDVAWLLPYLPKAAAFSDDGKTWRAGYGPRLRAWGQHLAPAVDQLAFVVDELKRNPGTRQAVISLWDPAEELAAVSYTKDMPCSNRLHFMVHGERLDLQVDIRSNDMVWGYSGVNAVNFTLLHELVARLVGRRLGVYRHTAGCMHAYERHWDMLGDMTNHLDLYALLEFYGGGGHTARGMYIEEGSAGVQGLDSFTAACAQAMAYVEAWRNDPSRPGVPDIGETARELELPVAHWLVQWAFLFCLHARRSMSATQWRQCVDQLAAFDWRVGVASYMARQRPELEGMLRDVLATVPMQAEWVDQYVAEQLHTHPVPGRG